jgi:hypothetical protein
MLAFSALAPSRHVNLYPDCKNCAMLRSLRLWWNFLHSQFAVTASIRLSTTNALYCRAVSTHFQAISCLIKRIKKPLRRSKLNPFLSLIFSVVPRPRHRSRLIITHAPF